MSQQAAALAAGCCCPREDVPPCTPTDSAVMLHLPKVRFQFGCRYLSWVCGNGNQGASVGCCCPSCFCFGNGSPCDSPAWNCREIKPSGEVEGSAVMRLEPGAYRTRVNCPQGINEALVGGRVLDEVHQCESIAWPGGGGITLYRQAAMGFRACVGNYIITTGCAQPICDTNCSRDQSPSVFMVQAVLRPYAGNATVNGCVSVVRRLDIYINCISATLAARWCECYPSYVFTDLLSADYSMTYESPCCPQSPTNGVRGTYVRAFADPPEITAECERSGPYTYAPVKWPNSVTIS